MKKIVIEMSKSVRFEIKVKNSGGTIESFGVLPDETTEIEETFSDEQEFQKCQAMVDTLESLILAHAVTGLNVNSVAYKRGIQTVLDKIDNECS